MCGRYAIVQKLETLEKRFNVTIKHPEFDYQPNYNVSPGDYAPVIINKEPEFLQFFQFGLTPWWAKKPMYLFNARSEGDRNKENDPAYKGGKGIIHKRAFEEPIRSKRCLVIADCFIEGTIVEKLSKPYVVYLRERRPFALAGIWDKWVNKETGEVRESYSLITTTANELIQKLPHHRSPVILSESQERQWLKDIPLNQVTGMLNPYPSEKMNAYPISTEIKHPAANGVHLLQPIGERVMPENDTGPVEGLERQGWGMGKRK